MFAPYSRHAIETRYTADVKGPTHSCIIYMRTEARAGMRMSVRACVFVVCGQIHVTAIVCCSLVHPEVCLLLYNGKQR